MKNTQITPPHFLLVILLIFSSISSLSAQAPIQYGSSDYEGNLHHLKNVAIGTDKVNKSKVFWIKAPGVLEAPCLNSISIPTYALYVEGKINQCPFSDPSTHAGKYHPYFTVSSYGNVGVGTDKPDYKFHLQGTGYASDDFYIDGNVGMGTTSPSEKLDVKGNLNIGNDNWTALKLDGTGDNNWLVNAHSDGEKFHIRSYDGSDYDDYRMTILRSSGNVGIGTTSPTAKLDVNGKTKTKQLTIARPDNYGYDLNVINDGSRTSFGNVYVDNILALTNLGRVGIGTSLPSEKLHVEGTTLLNGKVQIGNNTITAGTHNTNNVKLTVDGHAIFKKVIVTQSNWADHVFEENYELKTLGELENYINANKHLPEIPTTVEVQENGIELGEMNKLLLQKVEELTLYVIDLQDQINDLKTEE